MKTAEDYFLNTIQEIDLIEDMTDAAISASKKDIDAQVSNINRQMQNAEYVQEIKSLMRSDADCRNEKLLNEVRQLVPQVLSINKNNTYMYIIIGAICILLVASFVKKYI